MSDNDFLNKDMEDSDGSEDGSELNQELAELFGSFDEAEGIDGIDGIDDIDDIPFETSTEDDIPLDAVSFDALNNVVGDGTNEQEKEVQPAQEFVPSAEDIQSTEKTDEPVVKQEEKKPVSDVDVKPASSIPEVTFKQNTAPPPVQDDIPADIAESISARLNSMTASEDFQKDFARKMRTTRGMLNQETQIDKMIASALARDLSNSLDDDILDQPFEFVRDVTVYDTEVREKIDILPDDAEKAAGVPQEQEVKKDNAKPLEKSPVFELFDKISTKTKVIIISSMSATVLLLTISLVVLINIDNNNKAMQKKFTISQPDYVSNNQNFIYLGLKTTYKEEDLVLSKMLIDRLATVFYFNSAIDTRANSFTLFDNNGKMYGMDLSFNHTADKDGGNTVLRFEPLDENVKSFTLNVMDTYTEDKAEFTFTLDGKVKQTPLIYVNKSVDLLPDVPDIAAKVENAVFASSGSSINFSLRWSNPASEARFLDKGDSSYITLNTPTKTMRSLQSFPSQYYFEDYDMIIGRMDFDALPTLSTDLKVGIKNLFASYKPNLEGIVGAENGLIPALGLFANNEESKIVIPTGNYNVILECMYFNGDRYALILHTEDAFTGEVVESQLEVTLIGTTSSGMEIKLEGQSNSNEFGTDVYFFPNQLLDMMQSMPSSSFSLDIRNILIKVENASTEVSKSIMEPKIKLDNENAISAVVAAFKDRLKMKSQEITEGELTGFAQDVLRDSVLMQNYNPEQTSESPTYSAQVISYAAYDNSTLLAVVSEVWHGVDGEREILFNRTHKVVAKHNGLKWVVASDKIVQ